MSAVFLAFAWCVGSAIGSFLNVCILRWPKSESVVRPRSRCPKCGAEFIVTRGSDEAELRHDDTPLEQL